LSWSASSGAAGYNVYRSMTPHGPYERVNTARVPTTSFVDRFLKAATTYYYVVAAVDGSGAESSYSAEVVLGP
jgi:fibronectin type 3 domain-containing protein